LQIKTIFENKKIDSVPHLCVLGLFFSQLLGIVEFFYNYSFQLNDFS